MNRAINVRQSNIELARNVSMFMILMLHANFVALGYPSKEEFMCSPSTTIMRYFWEAVSIASVNVFVLISGWFGIRPSKKGVLKFIYQILFFLGLGYVITTICGVTRLNISQILDILQLSTKDWFIKSYFVLMILSPLLNRFVIDLDVLTQKRLLALFFFFEIVYGWAGGGVRFFVSGYGPLHLMGIYLLGQYLHYSLPKENRNSIIYRIFTMKPKFDILLFLLFAAFTTIMGVSVLIIIGKPLTAYTIAYSSPFVIGGGIFLFLFFQKLNIPYVPIINWLGASSFAVYLFHSEKTIRHDVFIPIIRAIYENNQGVSVIMLVFMFLLVVYIVSCLIDQFRIYSWNKLSKIIFKS